MRENVDAAASREHVRRDLNPQPAVLETAALPIELLTFGTLFRFLVDHVLVAPRTVLLVLDTTRLLALVLRGRVVAALALGAFQRDVVSHRGDSWLIM
jgi:hypothetical protein